MKWTAGGIVISPFLKRDPLVDYFDNVSPMEEIIYKGLRDKTGHTCELLRITGFLYIQIEMLHGRSARAKPFFEFIHIRWRALSERAIVATRPDPK